MKNLTIIVVILMISIPSFARTRGGGAVATLNLKALHLPANSSGGRALRNVNTTFTSFGITTLSLQGVVLADAGISKVIADIQALQTELSLNPARATLVKGLPVEIVGALKGAQYFKRSDLPVSEVIGDVAINGLIALRSGLSGETSVANQIGLYRLINQSARDMQITQAEIRAIVDYSLEKGIRLEEAANCR